MVKGVAGRTDGEAVSLEVVSSTEAFMGFQGLFLMNICSGRRTWLEDIVDVDVLTGEGTGVVLTLIDCRKRRANNISDFGQMKSRVHSS